MTDDRKKSAEKSGKDRTEDLDAEAKGPDKTDRAELLGEPGTVSGQGRAGGRLARKVGTKDELKRAHERPAGATRAKKGDQQENEQGD